MAEIEKPIAASLHGPVHGAGVGLTLASDPRVAAESTTLSVAFVKIGLIPDAGVTFFLPRVVGPGKAMEMSMLGESVDAEEAHRIGLVNRVFTDEKLEEETRTLAGRLAGMPPRALNRIKQALYASFETDLPTALEREARTRRCAATRRTTKRAWQRSSRSARRPLPEAEEERALDEGRWSSGQENAAYRTAAGERNTAGGREAAVKIRDATLADLPAIVEIYNSTVSSRRVTADPEPVSVEIRHVWFLEHDPQDYPLWVAEMDGEIVGWFGFEPFGKKPAYRATAEISVYVSEKHRRKGIAHGSSLSAAARPSASRP